MPKLLLQALGIGLLVTAIALAANILGTHNFLGLLILPFLLPVMLPATMITALLAHPAAGSGHQLSFFLYGWMLLFGSVFYGFFAYLFLQRARRRRNRPRT